MSEPGPAPSYLSPIASIAEPVYRAAIAKRNRAFDRGKRVSTASIPVISIGNLSVGGTGKTPVVMHVVLLLRELWKSPGIAMRGYKASPGALSDEQAEYLDRLPSVPIVANPDRVSGVKKLAGKLGADCAVLDDGFQHRFIARDLDVVLIDATRSPFNDRCLPAGWLREPVSSLDRAGAVVVTRADRVSEARLNELVAQIEAQTGKPPTAITTHTWEGLTVAADGVIRDANSLNGARVLVACAIGNPLAFVNQVSAAGAEVAMRVVKRDHHQWSKADAAALIERASKSDIDALLVTHKDWVKLREVIAEDDPILSKTLYPRVGIGFIEGAKALRKLIALAVRAPDESGAGPA